MATPYGWLALAGLLAALPLAAAADEATTASYFSASTLPPVQLAQLSPPSARESARSMGIPLYLSMQLNHRNVGLHAALWRSGELWMQRATLIGLGIKPEQLPSSDTPGDGWVAINALNGASAQYHASTQDATVQVPFDWLNWPSTTINVDDTSSPTASSSRGLLFNYDIYTAQSSHSQGGLGATTELRAFAPNQVLSSTMMSQYAWHNGSNGDDSINDGTASQPHNVRLDTTWTRAWPDHMLSLRVGDTLTASLPWTRATRIGGLQLGRNFRLQPYRITTPIPALMGTSALPSDIQLFVNGAQQYHGSIPAGPFAVNTPTGIIGAGNAQLVLTDAYGRSTTLQYSFYGTDALLAKGLSDWSAELGWIRQNYGWRSWDYGNKPVASGTWRYGLSDAFTVQGHAEATASLINAGGGGAWQIGPLGVLSASAAGSRYAGDSGHLLQLSHSWNQAPFYTSMEATRTSGNYRDSASLYDATYRKTSGRALVGYNNATLGLISVGMWYLNTGTYTNSPYAPGSDATSNPLAPNLQPAYTVGAQRYITLNWSRPIGNTGFASLSVNHNVTDHRASSVQLSFNWWLDGSINSGVAFNRLNHQDTVSAFASKGTPTDTGWGWGTAATAGPSGGAQARVEYQDDHYRANGSIANYGGLTTATAGANGSLIWMDGHAFASRRMDNSFAVVSTSGVPDVPVLRENNVVGRTNADGVLLVPQMHAYQRNQLAIDTLNLPAQMRIEKTQKTVTPTDRAGMLVTFDIQRLHAATVMMTDAQGKPLPIGSVVTASSSRPPEAGKPMFAASALVGIDGAAYFDNLPPHAILQAAAPTGYQCEARLSVPDIPPTDIPVLGPVACTTKAAP